MSQERNDRLLSRYLDGELRGEEEREALSLIARDPDLRAILRLELKLPATLKDDDSGFSFAVPEGFSDRVMQRIEAGSKNESTGRGVVYKMMKHHSFEIRPIYLAAALLLLAIGVGTIGWPGSGGQPVQDDLGMTSVSMELQHEVWMRFVYFDDEAETIEVAGDFSDWEPLSLTQETVGEQQVWTGIVPLSRGEHSYMFIRNGSQWTTDPLADVTRDDGFGNKNAVIYL